MFVIKSLRNANKNCEKLLSHQPNIQFRIYACDKIVTYILIIKKLDVPWEF